MRKMQARPLPQRNPETIAPALLTAEQAATYLNIGRSTVYELVSKRLLPVVRIGTSVRIRRESLDAWIVEQEQAG